MTFTTVLRFSLFVIFPAFIALNFLSAWLGIRLGAYFGRKAVAAEGAAGRVIFTLLGCIFNISAFLWGVFIPKEGQGNQIKVFKTLVWIFVLLVSIGGALFQCSLLFDVVHRVHFNSEHEVNQWYQNWFEEFKTRHPELKIEGEQDTLYWYPY